MPRAASHRKGPSRKACPREGGGAPASGALAQAAAARPGERHREDQERTMDMQITALEPSPASPGLRSGSRARADPEGGAASKLAPISQQI
jgi:hypothetical protein